LLAYQLKTDHRASFDLTQQVAQGQFEAANHASITGEEAGGGEVQGIDPMARLGEKILSLYGPEIEAEENEEAFATNFSLVKNSLSGLESMVGGR